MITNYHLLLLIAIILQVLIFTFFIIYIFITCSLLIKCPKSISGLISND